MDEDKKADDLNSSSYGWGGKNFKGRPFFRKYHGD